LRGLTIDKVRTVIQSTRKSHSRYGCVVKPYRKTGFFVHLRGSFGHMKTRILLGFTLGASSSTFSWVENLRVIKPGGISVFPDLLTLIALPVLTFGVLGWISRTRETLSRRDVRRTGMIMVVSGAVLFSISHLLLGIVRFSHLFIPLLPFGLAMAFTSFVVIGALSVWVASKWLTHADTVA
jgi:hypothetical protein